jgi:hypothetical protein
MLKTFAVIIGLLLCSSVSAETLIIRASGDCCESYPEFKAGSKAALIRGSAVVAETTLESDTNFVFSNVNPGRHSLIVSAEGHYPRKFINLEIGRDHIFDFELIARLQPIANMAILEGQIIVRFKPGVSEGAITGRLSKWGLGVLQRVPTGEKSAPPRHVVENMGNFNQVIATYDRSKDLADIMWEILKDPGVLECLPIYFSPKP